MSEEKAKYEPVLDIESIKKQYAARNEEQKEAEGKKEEEKQPPFSAKFLPNGVLEIRADMKAAVVNEDIYHMFRGFFDNTRDKALAIILTQKEQLEETRGKILKLNEANGHRSFLNRILKK